MDATEKTIRGGFLKFKHICKGTLKSEYLSYVVLWIGTRDLGI